MNMMWPFCVKRHVDVHLDTSITSIKMDIGNFSLTIRKPPLQVATKNKFWSLIMWQPKNFHHKPCGDWKFLVANLATTKFFLVTSLYKDWKFLLAREKSDYKSSIVATLVIENFGHYKVSNWKNSIIIHSGDRNFFDHHNVQQLKFFDHYMVQWLKEFGCRTLGW